MTHFIPDWIREKLDKLTHSPHNRLHRNNQKLHEAMDAHDHNKIEHFNKRKADIIKELINDPKYRCTCSITKAYPDCYSFFFWSGKEIVAKCHEPIDLAIKFNIKLTITQNGQTITPSDLAQLPSDLHPDDGDDTHL